MSELQPVPPLRIAVLGDFDGVHARRWLEVFVRRGHDVHAISYYRPAVALPDVTQHVLSGRPAPSTLTGGRGGGPRGGVLRRSIPPTAMRLLQARRYARAGLRRVLDEVSPDVFHAHYAVEHGFYGALADFHPYVVSTWGSDLLVESRKTFGRLIARRALRDADLVTANDASLARRARELGVGEDRLDVLHLGIDRLFLDAGRRSVNFYPDSSSQPAIISDRALEPLYNVDLVIRAFGLLAERVPEARLVIAGEGSERGRLEALAGRVAPAGSVTFTGRLHPARLAEQLAAAHVYVSVPSSDSMALSNVEAMAAGCFPILRDLPSLEGWLDDGVNGLTFGGSNAAALAERIEDALAGTELRGAAAAQNQALAESRGLRERNMLLMERHYYRLAGHPQTGAGEAI